MERSAGGDGRISGQQPNEWREHWKTQQAALENLPRPSSRWPLTIMKSSQMDAARLDEELSLMLQEQFIQVFQHFNSASIAAVEPELLALLRLMVFGVSVMRGKATLGGAMMNLMYRNERASASSKGQEASNICSTLHTSPMTRQQRILFGVGYVLLPYVWGRLGRYAASAEWSNRIDDDLMHADGSNQPTSLHWRSTVWRTMTWVDKWARVAALVNTLVFLVEGKYRNLLDRALGVRLVYEQVVAHRALSFEYLNRQLVWQELSDFLLFLLPLMNAQRIRQALRAALPRISDVVQVQTTASDSKVFKDSDDMKAKQTTSSTAGPCPICSTSEILQPWVAHPCGHTFCYYCLRAHCEADVNYCCPVDRVRIHAMKRWSPADMHGD